MNILGQEQPVIYKIDDMFDPATAQLFLTAQQNYANAVRQDYMQAAQDLKEYNGKYREFYSPYEKDNENWDRLVNEPIRNLMQNYGPDMLRSQEGRSMIAQTIASVPGGQLAKLKASAAQGLAALKVKAELESKGLYSQDYQDFLDQQAGRASFKDWDTLKDGVYNSTFSPFQGLGEVTDYIYKGRQPLYKGMKNGSRRYSYDYNDLLNAAKSNAQDFINTPRGAFEWKLAQQQAAKQNPNASKEDLINKAYDILDKRIADANMRYLSPDKYEADPFALKKYEHTLTMAEINAREAAKGRNGGGSDSEGHSHVSENMFAGFAHVSGRSVNDIKKSLLQDINSGKTDNMKQLTLDIKTAQRKKVHANRLNTRTQFLRNMSTSDLASNVSKSLGLNVGRDNTVSLSNAMGNRLYSAKAVSNHMYGTARVKLNSGETTVLSQNKSVDFNNYDYKMRPTGKVLTTLCKDGKVRTFAETQVWYKKSDEDALNANGDEVIKKSGKWNRTRDTYWYDTHITTQGSSVDVKNKDFIINPNYDDRYAPEIESMDVNIGKLFNDKASRTTEDARIN